MATTDWEFVYDGVVGFLTSPMWQIPVIGFIEKNCIGINYDSLFFNWIIYSKSSGMLPDT